MTQQFDEGVKEILMTILSLGATMYETDYVLDQLKKRPEPIEQKVQALTKAAQIAKTPQQVNAIKQVKIELKKTEQPKQAVKSIVKPKELTKEQHIYNRLVKGGLTSTAAIGIIANLKAESELDPTIKQYGGGPGRGLVQWEKGGRFDTDRINLVDFAKKKGTNWSDLDTQIDFILYELDKHPEYIRVKKLLNSAKSVEETTNIFLRKYEKAGIPHTGKRLKYAEELKSLAKNW